MRSHIANSNDLQYEALHRMLKDFSVSIEYAKKSDKVPVGGNFNAPPSLEEIDKAFNNKDFHKMTKMLLKVSTIVHRYIDSHKALILLDEAMKSPLKSEIYKHGFFNRNKITTCGDMLADARNEIFLSINSKKEEQESRIRFNNLK